MSNEKTLSKYIERYGEVDKVMNDCFPGVEKQLKKFTK